MYYLTGDSVTKSFLERLAKKNDFSLWPLKEEPFLFSKNTQQKFPIPLFVLAGKLNEKKLISLFTLPITFVLDANAQDDSIQNFLLHQEKNKLEDALGILLTCPVIYACDIADVFTQALHQRLSFSTARQTDIHLALHEALVNGLVHGNLEIGNELRRDSRNFIEYARILNERLTDPAYAQKSISLFATWNKKRLEIKIRDEGAGYIIKEPPMNCENSKTGRGIRLIAGTADSCTLDDFGREITLSFSLEEENKKTTDSLVLDKVSESDLSESKILIIEDNPSNQILVTQLLNVAGIKNIITAQDGVEGLQKVYAEKPDLIILDITMPRMNGYEVLYQLKKNKETQEIPVLIQTASDTRAARDKTFSSGATDFITKPLNPLEFFSRVKVHLENKLFVKHLEAQLKQIDEELKIAQTMQEALLPKKEQLEAYQQKYFLEIAYHFEPSSRLGGDYWQVLPLSNQKLAFYVCDFSGHGVGAALNTFRLHTLINQKDILIKTPARFLETLNEQFFQLLPRGQFSTFFFAIWDKEKEILTYSGAGSPFPILKQKNKCSFLDTSGMPLGILKETQYTDTQINFGKEDELILYSDAFIEQLNPQKKSLDYKGFLKIVKKNLASNGVSNQLAGILEAFRSFSKKPPVDDLTAVLIKRIK